MAPPVDSHVHGWCWKDPLPIIKTTQINQMTWMNFLLPNTSKSLTAKSAVRVLSLVRATATVNAHASAHSNHRAGRWNQRCFYIRTRTSKYSTETKSASSTQPFKQLKQTATKTTTRSCSQGRMGTCTATLVWEAMPKHFISKSHQVKNLRSS